MPTSKAYILRDDKEILEIRTPEGRDALPVGDFFLTNGDTVCVEVGKNSDQYIEIIQAGQKQPDEDIDRSKLKQEEQMALDASNWHQLVFNHETLQFNYMLNRK